LFSVGVQTIILLATIFGSTELGLKAIDLIITVLLIQIVAIFGAYLFSRISEKKGNFLALKITIFIWMIVCFCAFLLHKELPNVAIYFYSLGAVLGLVLGAIQSLARSTYSKLLPETQDHTTYFSFYDVTEKNSHCFRNFSIRIVICNHRFYAMECTLFGIIFLGIVYCFENNEKDEIRSVV
jgi:MFS transporter, UMF1 family